MRLWEVVVSDDSKLDLAVASAYRPWLRDLFQPGTDSEPDGESRHAGERPLGVAPVPAGVASRWEMLWTTSLDQMWQQGIHTLRYAVECAKKATTRPPRISPVTAASTWNHYLDAARAVVVLGPDEPFGYRLAIEPRRVVDLVREKSELTPKKSNQSRRPNEPSRRSSEPLREVTLPEEFDAWATFDEEQRLLATQLDVFLVRVFCSLIPEFRADHFCLTCKRPLPSVTPKGRESRSAVCSHCAFAKWKENKGVEGVRAVWRKSKSKHKPDAKPQEGGRGSKARGS